MDLFQDKRVTVLGLARSGEAAANLLSELGAHVLVSDLKTEEQLKAEVARLTRAHSNIQFRLGGHPEEIIKDADLIVKSPGIPMNIPVLKSAREKGIAVIDEVELAYRVCRAPIIAITGTKGKSTTSTLLGQILSKHRDGNVVVAGNIGKPITRYVLDLSESDLLVLEVSSFQLEATIHFAPEVSVILNIGQDHFDRHGGIAEYVAAKSRIFINQGSNKYTVLNADDPLTMACASRTRAKVILFSSQQMLDEGIYVENGEVIAKFPSGSPTLVGKEARVPIIGMRKLRIPGRHNLENAMAAVAVCLIYGVDREIIRGVLKSFSGLEHALEFVAEVSGVRFINDSKATNVMSLKAALESLDNKAILIMGGRDKGNDYTPLKSLVQDKVKDMVLIGESAENIQRSIGIYTNSHRATTMEDAVSLAYSLAEPGDTVLLSPACASFDMFSNYAERGERFKEAVRRIAKAESEEKKAPGLGT